MTIELVPLCTATFTLERPVRIKDCPTGSRFSIGVPSGTLEGERFKGTLTGPAGDWLLMGADGTGTLHVHGQFETPDGALVYMSYEGRQDLSQGPSATIYVAPKFETGDERYAWLNKIQAIGKGKIEGATLTYEFYEVR